MLARKKEEEGNLGDVEMGRGHLVVVGKGEGELEGKGVGAGPGGRLGPLILSKGTKR